jgi:cobalt-zinc-cadmium efflux system protein
MADVYQGSAAGRSKRQLLIVFALTTTYMLAEVIGGLLTRSLALLADAAHMLTDAGALGLALFAIRIAERPASPQKTFGYYRVEILAALANATVLLLITVYILYEAWQRFKSPPEVLSWPMLIVATVGLGVNLIGMWLLRKSSAASLNVKGAYLEVLSDMLGSLGVITASLIMLTTGWYLADPIIGAGIGLFIVPRTWTLLKQAVHILMEGVPARLDLTMIEKRLKDVPGVVTIHDLHVWTVTSGLDAMSAHLVVARSAEGSRILAEVQRVLRAEFEITHTTIQLENEGTSGDERSSF